MLYPEIWSSDGGRKSRLADLASIPSPLSSFGFVEAMRGDFDSGIAFMTCAILVGAGLIHVLGSEQ